MTTPWPVLQAATAILVVGTAYGAHAQTPAPQPEPAETADTADTADTAGQAEAGARSDSAAQAQPRPRVVLVVVGESDATIRARAERLGAGLQEHAGLALPSDEALRAALLGAPVPSPAASPAASPASATAAGADDGLGPARAARRSLGWDAAADRTTLARIGELSRAQAVATLQGRPDGAMRVSVFAVRAQAFFPDHIDIPPRGSLVPAARFIRNRTRRAAQAADTSGLADTSHRGELETGAPASPLSPNAAASGTEGADGSQRTTPPPGAEMTPEPEERPARRFFRKNWPYLLLATVVVGVATGAIVSRRRGGGDDPQQLFFRFQPAP